jgi:excisionase family DNA binding protein
MAAETMTTSEAAQLLGVSARQVQRLTERGTIRKIDSVGRTALLDAQSVLSLAQHGGPGRGRRWHETTVWAALALLDNRESGWPHDTSRRWHLRNRLAGMSVEDLIRVARSRATVLRFRASTSFLESLAERVTRTGLSALSDEMLAKKLGLAVARTEGLDGYLSRDQLDDLVARFHLVEDPAGNVTLRVAPDEAPLHPGGHVDASVLALDLAESLDPRQRAAGTRYLSRQLTGL